MIYTNTVVYWIVIHWLLRTYFQSMSNSKFTGVQTSMNHKLVSCWVIGINQTVNVLENTSTTVRLTQFIAMLHFGKSNGFRFESNQIVSFEDQSLAVVFSTSVHGVSTCPVTKCPSKRSHVCIHSSILKVSPIDLDQKLVLSNDSCIAKKV